MAPKGKAKAEAKAGAKAKTTAKVKATAKATTKAAAKAKVKAKAPAPKAVVKAKAKAGVAKAKAKAGVAKATAGKALTKAAADKAAAKAAAKAKAVPKDEAAAARAEEKQPEASPPVAQLPLTPAADALAGSTPRGRKPKIGAGGLPVEVLDFLAFVSDSETTTAHMAEAGVATENVLAKDVVRDGYTWLKAVERELAKPDVNASTLSLLSNSFRSAVPLRDSPDFGVGGVINSAAALQRCHDVVEMLDDIEAAHAERRLLQAAGDGGRDQVKVVELYRKLRCNMQPVREGTDSWNVVSRYLHGSLDAAKHGFELKIRSVLSVDRVAEQGRFARYASDPNRMLLWYGCRPTSWLSLLARGPRIAPKEAPDMGYPFGRGVYFSDSAHEAALRCHASRASSRGALLLAEVALGTCRRLLAHDRHADRLPPGFHSVHAFGARAPEPQQDWRTPEGVRVPLGAQRPQSLDGYVSPLELNQFIVYNTAQVRMRYIVEVDFVYT